MEFKYELKKMNVVKVTNDKDTKDKLIAQGFKLIEKPKADKLKDDKSKEDIEEEKATEIEKPKK